MCHMQVAARSAKSANVASQMQDEKIATCDVGLISSSCHGYLLLVTTLQLCISKTLTRIRWAISGEEEVVF